MVFNIYLSTNLVPYKDEYQVTVDQENAQEAEEHFKLLIFKFGWGKLIYGIINSVVNNKCILY